MKTERRHELHTNHLSDWVNKQVELIQPYSKPILGGLLVCAALLATYWIFSSQDKKKQNESWLSYFQASNENNAEELLEVSEVHEDTIAAIWAKHLAAIRYRERGQLLLYGQNAKPDQGAADIESAARMFKEIIAEAENTKGNFTLILQIAHLNCGYCYESLENKIPDAIKQYELITSAWPDSAMAEKAQERIDAIATNQGRENQAWLLTHSPLPPVELPPLTQPEFGEGTDSPFVLPERDDLERSLDGLLDPGSGENGFEGFYDPSSEGEETDPAASGGAYPSEEGETLIPDEPAEVETPSEPEGEAQESEVPPAYSPLSDPVEEGNSTPSTDDSTEIPTDS